MISPLSVVSLLVSARAVLVQRKHIYEYGTEIFVGTPAQRYEMGVEFASSDLLLFAGDECRSPFATELSHSSTLHTDSRGDLVDNVTLAGVGFDSLPITLVRAAENPGKLHQVDADGVIGLGPKSPIALARILSLEPVQLSGRRTGGLDLGLDLQLEASIPAANEELEFDQTLNVTNTSGAVGWAI